MGTQVINNTGEYRWFTPNDIIEKVHNVMGWIDLDPASEPEANEIVGAKKIFTKEDDGLIQEWYGKIFMNPPFLKGLIDKFIYKLIYSPKVEEYIALINNITDTRYGQEILKDCDLVLFPKGRIRFIAPNDRDINKKSAPTSGQMIVYRGKNKHLFQNEFNEKGVIFWNLKEEK